MQDHYIIVGNGVAGIEAAMTLRSRRDRRAARITVISKESDYFFSRTALMYAYMDRMERRDLEPYERGVYARQHIELRRDEVIDLDAEAHTIALKSGERMQYTKLLLACGAAPRRVPFEGLEGSTRGVVHFVSLQDLEACERLTPSTQRAVVVGGGLIGIELVECLLHHGIHVTFLVREARYWPAALSEREAKRVEAHIRHHGVDLRLGEEIERVHVDADERVEAITTTGGERLKAELLGLCIGVAAHVDWLKEAKTPPEIDRALKVDDAFRTSLQDVYGAGDCVQIELGQERPVIETIWYSAKRHGRLAALSMLGDAISYRPPLFFNSSKFIDIEFTTVGDVIGLSDRARALWRTHPKAPYLTQLITFAPAERDRVLGFNLLGSRWNHELLERWVRERRPIEYVTTHLHTAQFDVEFGRAKLHAMHQEEIDAP